MEPLIPAFSGQQLLREPTALWEWMDLSIRTLDSLVLINFPLRTLRMRPCCYVSDYPLTSLTQKLATEHSRNLFRTLRCFCLRGSRRLLREMSPCFKIHIWRDWGYFGGNYSWLPLIRISLNVAEVVFMPWRDTLASTCCVIGAERGCQHPHWPNRGQLEQWECQWYS